MRLSLLAPAALLALACASPKVLPLVPGGEAHNFGYEARLFQVDATHWQVVVTLPSDYSGGWSGGLRGEGLQVDVWGGGLTSGAPRAVWTFDADRWRKGEPFLLELRQNVAVLVEVKLGTTLGSADDFKISLLERK
jgi:hypothetical protein